MEDYEYKYEEFQNDNDDTDNDGMISCICPRTLGLLLSVNASNYPCLDSIRQLKILIKTLSRREHPSFIMRVVSSDVPYWN